MNSIRRLGQAVGVDADDLQILGVMTVLVLVLGLLLVMLAGAAGVAVAVFLHLAGV